LEAFISKGGLPYLPGPEYGYDLRGIQEPEDFPLQSSGNVNFVPAIFHSD